MAHVPEDAALVVALRPAALWKKPELKSLAVEWLQD